MQRTLKFARYGGLALLSSVAGVVAIGAGIFVHDAFTYTDKHVDRVPISPLALHPENGGPKNLPVVSSYVDDEEDDEQIALGKKPRLVIVGGGWGVSAARISAWIVAECVTGRSYSSNTTSRRLPCNTYIRRNIHHFYSSAAM